jgi:hypothetical protein
MKVAPFKVMVIFGADAGASATSAEGADVPARPNALLAAKNVRLLTSAPLMMNE